jgi:FtsP/CotA-like multicopper oxidase with cupredoxin domain
MEINGVAQGEVNLHDTVNLPFAAGSQPGIVKVRMPFDDPNLVGEFVYHCHILEHEDGGMMQVIELLPAKGAPTVAVSRTRHGKSH